MRLLKRSIWMFICLVIAVPVFIYAAINWYQNKFERLPILGQTQITENGKRMPQQIQEFEFRNQNGKMFSSGKLKNKIIVANFFFTSCTGICPDMMKHLKKVQHTFINDTAVAFISFSVDPVRDSSARLKLYCDKYNIDNSNWNLLTGDKIDIYRLARKSFYLSAGDGDGGENDFIHSDKLVLVDNNKYIRGYYSGTDDKVVDQLTQDIKKLEHEN